MNGDRPIALTGFMTAGKTTIGPQLAMRLGLDFADLDGLLEEQENAPIAELFERLGEDGFRDLESTALERALAGPPRVLATGGGVVMREPNRRQLARRAHVVWLDLRFETVAARLRANPDGVRPLAARLGTDALRELHHRRRPLYASCAHLRVDADRDAPGRLARRIALHLRRAGH
jgi:shikimate kinase